MNYIVLSELGHGGMASVWLAKHKTLDAEFAIKILDKRFISDENIRKRFLSEAKIMSKMNHPNIVRVTDLIDEPDTVAFVMEHVPGVTLKELIEKRGKPNDSSVKNLFSQIISATKFIHEQGLIHRDIKPSNFMVTSENQVKLMDFGIAKVMDANASEYTGTGSSQLMGTPMYMSPEQVRASGTVTFASDIYSLGVTLWHVVTGAKPYDTGSLSLPEIQVAILKENLPLTGTIWDGVIQKATKKNPSERFASDADFLAGIMNPESVPLVLHSEKFDIPAEPSPMIQTSNDETQKKSNAKVLPVIVSVLIFAAIVCAGVYFFLKPSPSSEVGSESTLNSGSAFRCSNPNCINTEVFQQPGNCIDCGQALLAIEDGSPEATDTPEYVEDVPDQPSNVEPQTFVDQPNNSYVDESRKQESTAREERRRAREERKKAQQQGNLVKCSYGGCSNMTTSTNLIYDSPYKPFCSERCRQRYLN
jgi:serine/threonine protein kinase